MSTEKQKILLVDDEPRVLASLRLHLCRDHDVVTTSNPKEAIDQLLVEKFAVLITDMRMPGMDGVELLRRAHKASPATTRILLTGYANLESAMSAVNDGRVFRFLTKPCAPPLLRATVDAAIRHHRMITADQNEVRSEAEELFNQLVRAERLATLGTMASAVGHELSNIAAVYSSVLHMVVASVKSDVKVDAEDLEDLLWVEKHLRAHSEALLNLGRPRDYEPVAEDVRLLAASVVERLTMMGRLKYVNVESNFESVPDVWGVPTEIEQIIINLLSNAADAVGNKADGKVVLTVSECPDTRMVMIAVKDNGSGVSDEHREQIFNPYFTTKSTSGTGLGLVIVKRLVEEQGGHIEFESFEGQGTTFRVRLPPARVESLEEETVERVVEVH